MGPPVVKVQSDTTLPQSTSVVIIGGGIIGTSAALFLSQRGIPTVLCEKGHIAGEQSSRNWGWCRKMARDPREIPLAIEALRLWGDMNRITGVETGYRQSGIMYHVRHAAGTRPLRAWMDARPRLSARHADAERCGGFGADARRLENLGGCDLHGQATARASRRWAHR